MEGLVEESQYSEQKGRSLFETARSLTSTGHNIRRPIRAYGQNETYVIEKQNQYNDEILNQIKE